MEETKSKSQKKRDASALQKLGLELLSLTTAQLDKLALPENLYQALIAAKSIKSHGAIRRQAQLIGKLMREADSETILEAYHSILAESNTQTATFHALELWREKLINEGKAALTEFIMSHPSIDVQQLRQLVKKAMEEKQTGKNTGAAKALFRFLRLNSL